MGAPGAKGQGDARTGLPPAALIVLHPSGQRTRTAIEALPFLIGRQPDNNLVLRDNRASRTHARIVAENGHYILEDLDSRHGTFVNGERVARHILRNSDRIDLGVPESYQLTFTLEAGEINRILDQISTSRSGGMGDNNLAKLRSLVEVARALQNSLSTQEVLTAVVDAALAVTGCERGFLLLRKGDSLEVSVARDLAGQPLDASDLRVPTSVIQRALNSRRELLSMSFNPGSTETLEGIDRSVAALELRSAVCVPLVLVQSGSMEETRIASHAQQTVGLLYLDSRLSPADLSAGNREVLTTLAIEASTILENARLMEDQRVKLLMESELKVAREIQRGLAPVSLPSEGWFRAAGSSWASNEVGGDYFDVRQVSADVWAAVVADVSGKGVSSALLASLLQGAFLMASGDFAEIEPTMSHLNRFLLERARGEKYATVFYCMVNSEGLLSYANAGHCAPFLVSLDGRLRKLHTSGMPVGMLEEAQFQVIQMQLESGDKIVVYSDGLTEAENAAGEFFDTERLRACLRDNASMGAADLHKVLLSTLDAFVEGGVIRDDITALVLEYT
ncbi:MAG TPA: SpoIIE family protein phosphatase [Bryobacteraceae bacterium]|jgi:serine phosphatase RsbU (regulator of sigma subunit)|nr:SpoIIE family protein phosphatase [Bryobacteraceae bacterium]